eukprot:541860_1
MTSSIVFTSNDNNQNNNNNTDSNIFEGTQGKKQIDSFLDGIETRHRSDVIVNKKRPLVDKCINKCNCKCKKNNTTTEYKEPPKRYIYWGSHFDTHIDDNIRTTKNPHIENEDICNDFKYGSPFVSNYTSTTKYTVWTFLPLNLLEQFKKKANLYFLIIACMAFSKYSPKDPIFSIFPLLFVLSVSAVKEGWEDHKRYNMDKEVNNRLVDVFRPNENGNDWKFIQIAWKDVQVGDMIRISNEHPIIPADILLLQSSTNQGLCNIETANLDGETNLKIKQAIGVTYALPTDSYGNEYPLNKQLQFKLECEAPNENINKWNGVLYFYNSSESISCNIKQMILRGCTLRNTDWIIGIVVFTGIETKISLNSKKSKFKRSNVDITVDYGLYFIFLVQQLLCIFAAIYHGIWLNINAEPEWYQYINSDGTSEINYAEQAILNYFTFLVLLDILVPISLYVSMELVKFTQAYLITCDDSMVEIIQDETNIRIHAQARTSNLNEELGQISYIFSDKTGTLTENKMAFLKCHVDGIRYGPN